MKRQRVEGFTLLEVVLVAVTIAILAAIALPSYQNQVRRSNRSAAQQFLQDLATREEQYRLDARDYTTSISALGWGATPNNVSANYTVASVLTGVVLQNPNSTDCTSVAASSDPTYVIKAVAINSQIPDGDLCLDSSGTKNPPDKW